MPRRGSVAWPLLVALLAIAPSVRADPAAAEALFREGRRLLLDGKLDVACPKLEESQRQDPSSGTLLNLALCHEKQGHLAKAWAEYLEAAELARTQEKPDRAAAADEQARALEQRLPKLRVDTRELIPGLEIMLDGRPLGLGAVGTAFPVDPGEHALSAKAPGRKPWTQTATLVERETTVLQIPALEREEPPAAAEPALPVAAPSPPRAPVRADPGPVRAERAQPLAPWLVGGAGVLALGVGTYFGVRSLGRYADAEDLCPERVGCGEDAMNARDSAERDAWIADIALGVGFIGVGTGVVLLLTGSSEEPAGLRVSASSSSGGVSFRQRF